ncbi:hypothetical protein [Acidovorax cavernicola]|uniref:Uncharacterized protein n=1 Tax=Acidovorax cavernicola TaxID=1675792 RepID=A0A9X8GTF2_9BURK|nr:hypothetical protein [Acidovorax cavernicola]RIX76317.1 hypothetical protein D3H34_22490 [Acidovorax cavernicola]
MDDQWQAIRADILDIADGDSTRWVRIKTLVSHAYRRGLTTNTGPVLANTLEWAEQQGLVEVRAGPPELGLARLTVAGTI